MALKHTNYSVGHVPFPFPFPFRHASVYTEQPEQLQVYFTL